MPRGDGFAGSLSRRLVGLRRTLSASSFNKSKYLNASSLQPGEREIVKITAAEAVKFLDNAEETLAIQVTSKRFPNKWISINKTRGTVLSEAYGDDAELWVDHSIILTRGRGTYMGKPCGTLDVTPILPDGHRAVSAVPPPPDDDVPPADHDPNDDRFAPEGYDDAE
jgi:hypothetical protein